METIKVPENIMYLTEWVGFELPKGIFNKGVTGCGATTVAIKDDHKTIICCPRINLILNKCMQNEGILGVYGDVGNCEIKEYLRKTAVPKIMVTYDSFPRIAKLIEDKEDWRVVVDEYQYLLIDSGFRSDKAIELIKSIRQFDYVTYLSATPIADKYMKELKEFEDIPYTVLDWSNTEKTKIVRMESKNPINNALQIVRNYQSGNFPEIDGLVSKECVIFLNSVTNIVNIIKQCGLKPEEVNIIVANNEENKKYVQKLGKEYEIGECPKKGDSHKMFTFCTSTAFAGCDFYSTCASTFVVSDSKRVHTSIDIATELVQIVGRQRLAENPFRKIVFFIYSLDIGMNNEKDYKDKLKEKLNMSEEVADFNNKAEGVVRENIRKKTNEMQNIKKYSEDYVRYDYDKDLFIVNRWAYLNELFAYDVQHENYVSSAVVRNQLEKNGLNPLGDPHLLDYKEQLKCILVKEGFAEKMKRYCELRKMKETSKFFIASGIMERQDEELKLYYDKLGYDRIKALGYKEHRILSELEQHFRKNDIQSEFRKIFRVGMRVTTDDIKNKMAEVYMSYGVTKNGVATHLYKEYGIKMKQVKISMPDGSRKGGYEFI